MAGWYREGSLLAYYLQSTFMPPLPGSCPAASPPGTLRLGVQNLGASTTM